MLFGTVRDGQMRLNTIGKAVGEEWLRSQEIRTEVALDEFVVMPNHFHAIVFLCRNSSEAAALPAASELHGSPGRSLSSLVQGFKASVAKRVGGMSRPPGAPVWQRNFHERVLRNERELNAAREYVAANPRKWAEDKNNPTFRYSYKP